MSGKKRYGMVVDLRKCAGCHGCTIACKSENNVPLGVFRTWIKQVETGTYPNVRMLFMPRFCNHCENPPCVTICPVNASYQREDGIVLIDQKRCIGCKYCIAACPYDARFINPETDTADKCTFCVHRLDNGLQPACVTTCIGEALTFGDLNDPNSKISQLIANNATTTLKPELGTKPNVFYIGADDVLMERGR